jgi:hypothetical protein
VSSLLGILTGLAFANDVSLMSFLALDRREELMQHLMIPMMIAITSKPRTIVTGMEICKFCVNNAFAASSALPALHDPAWQKPPNPQGEPSTSMVCKTMH